MLHDPRVLSLASSSSHSPLNATALEIVQRCLLYYEHWDNQAFKQACASLSFSLKDSPLVPRWIYYCENENFHMKFFFLLPNYITKRMAIEDNSAPPPVIRVSEQKTTLAISIRAYLVTVLIEFENLRESYLN